MFVSALLTPLHNRFKLEQLVPGCLQAALLPRTDADRKQQHPSIPPLSASDVFPVTANGQKNPCQPSCFCLFVSTLHSQNQKVNSVHIHICSGLFVVVIRDDHIYS